MKQIFDKPQLKEGTYRAFIFEPGHVVVISLVDRKEDLFITSEKNFIEAEANNSSDYFVSFDTWGKGANVDRMVRGNFEEVIV